MARGLGLNGRRAVVTGAGGSIGSALVAALAGEGAMVTACDRAFAGELPGAARRVAFDLQDAGAVARGADEALADGPPDLVVSNAGWTRADAFEAVGDAAIRDELDGNFTGTALLTNRLRAAMRAGGRGGAFVFVLSANARAHFGNPPYSAAKAALGAWSRAIAVEEGAHGIRSNAVLPASVRTHAWDYRTERDPGVLDRLATLYPLGRLVEVEEVVNAVLFLLSPLASGITGAELLVDGGLMAGSLPFLDIIQPGRRPA